MSKLYINPPGSPAVEFDGPVSYTLSALSVVCRVFGAKLDLARCPGLDGARILWALAGNESDFGANCKPHHEASYCTGGAYSHNAEVEYLTRLYGHAAHCSFGPWQVMLPSCTAKQARPEQFYDIANALQPAIALLNTRILGEQKAATLEEIADAYNSGTWRDRNVPHVYIASFLRNYHAVPLP